MPLALIHDWLNQIGGAEDVLENLVRLFPGTPIFTSIYWPEQMPPHYREWDIRVSFMDRLPLVHQHHQPYLLAYPRAFERFDLSGYDLVLSHKSGLCHRVRPASRPPLRPSRPGLQKGDRAAAQRVDHFIAISSEVQRRIARFYGRESVVIYPPVAIDRFNVAGLVVDYF